MTTIYLQLFKYLEVLLDTSLHFIAGSDKELTMNTATDASPIAPYSYPTTNSDLKQHHELIPHVEGGYFIPSVALHNNDSENDSNRIAVGPGLILKDENGKEEEETDPDKLRGKYGAPLASSIYHLLDPDSSRLYMHVNRNGVRHAASIILTLSWPELTEY